MSEIHYTTKQHYKHLTDKERGQIEILLNEGYTISKIATLLQRHTSTISREIKRGSVLQKQYLYGYKEVLQPTYFSDTAHLLSQQRKQHSVKRSIRHKLSRQFMSQLISTLSQKIRIHSVDTFVNTYKKQYPDEIVPCTKTVYNWIHNQSIPLKPIDLPRIVRIRHKTTPSRLKQHKRCLGKSIEQRPVEVALCQSFGHWEIDLMIGK